jgi:hypothetical protein
MSLAPMPNLRFDQLVDIYRNIQFAASEPEGELTVTSQEIRASLELLQQDPVAAEDANLDIQTDVLPPVGGKVPVYAGAPRVGTGFLVRTLDDLLRTREARLREPPRYFIIEGGIDRKTDPPHEIFAAYRVVLRFVELLADCAAYVDPVRQEMIFFTDRKIVIPVRYNTAELEKASLPEIEALLGQFADNVHIDQKRAILTDALTTAAEPQSLAERFPYLLRNVEALHEAVKTGYTLFASTFSYAKIRGEVEAAKVEYVSKIHKTLIDIQGQLLGIPIATVVVASQLKASTGCDTEVWTNRAVLGGVWVFVVLLGIAIINQWLTLNAIGEDVAGQRRRLTTDYAAIGERFSDVFKTLDSRIRWHYGVLLVVVIIAVFGASFATAAYVRLTETSNGACVRKAEEASPRPVQRPPVPRPKSDALRPAAVSPSPASAQTAPQGPPKPGGSPVPAHRGVLGGY